jgi:hypothetical protein
VVTFLQTIQNFPAWIHSKIAVILNLYANLTSGDINIEKKALHNVFTIWDGD